jgi:vacuolar-type H+-ATPase subunit H
MTVLDFIKNIATRAGIKDNQEFDLALAGSASEALKGLELPESVVNQVNTNLMDFNSAKSNLDLKNHFNGQAFGGVETSVFEILKNSGWEDTEIEEIKSASKSTGQRISKVLEKYNSRIEEAKKHKPGSDEYVRKLSEAQNALAEATKKFESEKTQILETQKAKQQNLWMRNQLASVQWNEAIPEIAREATYNAAMANQLSKLDAKLVFDPETLTAKLVNAKDETLPLVVSGKEFAFNDLHSVILQEHKLMKEAGGGNPNPSPTQPFTPSNNNGGGSTEPKLHPSTAAALAKLNIPS